MYMIKLNARVSQCVFSVGVFNINVTFALVAHSLRITIVVGSDYVLLSWNHDSVFSCE